MCNERLCESNGNVSLCGTKSEQSAGHNCIAGRKVEELLHSLHSRHSEALACRSAKAAPCCEMKDVLPSQKQGIVM